MYKEVLRSIEGVGIYPVTSFIIFFGAFCLMLLWVITYDKKTISEVETLPLNNDSSENIETIKP
jgi:cytochrome c oxidase cbb3-type subunit IV